MRPLVAALLAGLVAATIAFFVFFFRPVLTISVTPPTATISVDGQQATGQGTFALMPGVHEIKITQDGYIPLVKSERLRVAQQLSLTIPLLPIQKVEAVTDGRVTLIGLSSDKKSVLFIGNVGRTLLALTGKEQKPLTPDTLASPTLFTMSPTQDVAILRQGNGDIALYDFKRYDLVKQEQLFYGRSIDAIDWVYPAGEKLLYSYGTSAGERSLVLADRTNKELDRVYNLREGDLTAPTVAVAPDGKTAVLVSRPGTDFANYKMYVFDFFSKRLKQLTNDGNKINARFSPSGQRILYTRYEQDPASLNNQLISVMDLDGKNRKDFNLRATLDQVAFLDETHLVVATTRADGDTLSRLDLASGETTPYYHDPLKDLHVNKLVLSGDSKTAYVTVTANLKEQGGTLDMIKLQTDEY